MASKNQSNDSSSAMLTPNINIDINDSGAQSNVKNMSMDSSNDGRAGLSKDELLKYANQPFWTRLRNILFATFWIVWLSILVAAIGYVINSPGCNKITINPNSTAQATASSS